MSRDRVRLLTPMAVSALAVVRLSGPGVGPFLARRFSARPAVGRAVHGLLRDGETIDDPVVVLVDSGTADVTVHGGRQVVRSVLALAERDGFAIAAPPPADTLDAEVMAALQTAATPTVVRMLLAQSAAWAGLTDPAAVLSDPSGRHLVYPPTVAIVGPPNVGKSTLANRLFGTDRSITADAPGTTRDWVGGVADVGGLAVVLVDTAGVRDTADPIEAAAIAAGQTEAVAADLHLIVLDRSKPLDDDARRMIAAHPSAVRVANKVDRQAAWADADAIGTVATTGDGFDAVRSTIRRRFGCDPIDPRRPRWWTDRQRAELARISQASGVV